jgi:hypothetical protein
MVTVYF